MLSCSQIAEHAELRIPRLNLLDQWFDNILLLFQNYMLRLLQLVLVTLEFRSQLSLHFQMLFCKFIKSSFSFICEFGHLAHIDTILKDFNVPLDDSQLIILCFNFLLKIRVLSL